MTNLDEIITGVYKNILPLKEKPYTSKLNVCSVVAGTVIWFESYLTMDSSGNPTSGYAEVVRDIRQWWGAGGYYGSWINGKLYPRGTSFDVVIGASVK